MMSLKKSTKSQMSSSSSVPSTFSTTSKAVSSHSMEEMILHPNLPKKKALRKIRPSNRS
ncbi:unnamed protein product [Gongylonema pulchrum]|uniref:Uncharacterized protein n=1 Tax=Gongylonema pulchrum TaxID=637853 RepID=A0A3P7P699_9BILA|nr:unnamed protein product [Gongylonema pulchrum]